MLAWSGAPDLRLGALLIVGACVCWGLDNCVTADLDDISPEHITLVKGVIAGCANVALGLALGGGLPAAGHTALVLLPGAVGYGASITLWVAGARDLGAARGQLVFSSAPFIGVVVAWIGLGDDVRVAEVAALVLAAAGVLRVLASDHDHRHEHGAIEHDHEHDHDDDHHDHAHPPGQPAGSRRHSHRHVHRPSSMPIPTSPTCTTATATAEPLRGRSPPPRR